MAQGGEIFSLFADGGQAWGMTMRKRKRYNIHLYLLFVLLQFSWCLRNPPHALHGAGHGGRVLVVSVSP